MSAMSDRTSGSRPDDDLRRRYMTLAEARALECNQCGDCCDSRRTDGYWTWGSLPEDGYAAQCVEEGRATGERAEEGREGVPLIIPIALVDGAWQDRGHRPEDLFEFSGTRFRCTAFTPTPPSEAHPGGGGSCARHDRWRPAACDEFPVGAPDLEDDVARLGEVPLETGAFPRCTWYRVTVVSDGDPRIVRT